MKKKLKKKKFRKLEKGETAWLDPAFGSGPRIKVKIVKNENMIPDNTGEEDTEWVPAYTVEWRNSGKPEKRVLVSQTRLHETETNI